MKKIMKAVFFLCCFVIIFLGAWFMVFKGKMSAVLNHYGTVIIVNGPSSVGKSSIVKAFQQKRLDPWLCTGIDQLYIGVLPQHFLDNKLEHHVVMHVTYDKHDGNDVVAAVFGPAGQKVIRGMHRAIAAYAHTGNNVIVDYIQYEQAWVDDLKEVLAGINVVWVGVTASLDSIEDREKSRGTSPVGHARSHYDTVHKGIKYDLMLDNDLLNPDQAAGKICNFLEKTLEKGKNKQ